MTTTTNLLPFSASSKYAAQLRRLIATGTVTLLAIMLLSVYLMPMAYMVATSLKDKAQFTETSGPLWPAREATFTYQGREYPLYKVPTEDGVKEWALVEKGREQSSFIDPANPEAGLIEWQGRWRTLERAWVFSPRWENFSTAYRLLDFGRLLRNTLAIALTGTIGTVLSCTLVAYGFARFRIPGKNIIFLILLATIILPPQVTLVPTYAVFARIGWVGTWLPLIVPHFFANAYNVFLLRQYFLTLPRELDEAAMMDGASPFRVLISVILPQAIPALTAVSLFHFFWAWNDFFGPLIYLAAEPELQPISVGIQVFNFIYGREPHMIQATAIMALALPVVLFFLSQRVFMQGVVITGVEK